MGTRSHIGMLQPDGTVMAIYCHWDGYPENNGKILMEHYTDPEKVKALIALGSLSSLGPELGEKHDFDRVPENYSGCTAHHRDRDEDLAVDNHKNVDFYLCGKNDSCGGGEWRYLWDGTQWLGAREDGDTFIPIPELLKKNAEDDGD